MSTLADTPSDLSSINVEVTNPETPFGGVQVFGADPLQDLSSITVEVSTADTPFGGVQVFGATDPPINVLIHEGPQGPAGPAGPPGEGVEGPVGGGATEVWSGPDAPVPQDEYLLWIDTDEPTPIGGGGAGGGDLTFVHNQVALSASWSVAHNLGNFPSVNVVDSGGSLIIPNVSYVNSNNVTISFAAATSGKAYLN
jgi:hypothetical protein